MPLFSLQWEAIQQAARTDRVGDDKILVLPVDEAVRICIGEPTPTRCEAGDQGSFPLARAKAEIQRDGSVASSGPPLPRG